LIRRFKVGDKVQATYKNQTTQRYYGTGTITDFRLKSGYMVQLDNGDSYIFYDFELEIDREVVQFT